MKRSRAIITMMMMMTMTVIMVFGDVDDDDDSNHGNDDDADDDHLQLGDELDRIRCLSDLPRCLHCIIIIIEIITFVKIIIFKLQSAK